jgi:hypothetical protein
MQGDVSSEKYLYDGLTSREEVIHGQLMTAILQTTPFLPSLVAVATM